MPGDEARREAREQHPSARGPTGRRRGSTAGRFSRQRGGPGGGLGSGRGGRSAGRGGRRESGTVAVAPSPERARARSLRRPGRPPERGRTAGGGDRACGGPALRAGCDFPARIDRQELAIVGVDFGPREWDPGDNRCRTGNRRPVFVGRHWRNWPCFASYYRGDFSGGKIHAKVRWLLG
jgi:hypothetical protein